MIIGLSSEVSGPAQPPIPLVVDDLDGLRIEQSIDVLADYIASGYTVIKADTLDEAVELAKGCPILQAGCQVSVFETFTAMQAEPHFRNGPSFLGLFGFLGRRSSAGG